MRRQGIFDNYSDSFLRDLNNDEEGQISSNNRINSGHSQTSDLQKLSSSIICSANITRKSLLQESTVTSRSNNYTVVNDDDDDDDEFFKTIKHNIDRNLLQNSKENYKPNRTQPDIFAQKRKKPIIDEETLNVIKRFKKDANIVRTNFLETPTNNMSPRQSNSFFDNTVRHPYELPRNVNVIEDVMTQQNTKRCPVYNLPTSTDDIGNIVRQKSTTTYPMYNLPTRTNDIGNIVRQKSTTTYPMYNLPTSTNDIGNIIRQKSTTTYPMYNLPTSTNDRRNIVRQENTIRCPYNLPASTNDIRNIVRQENTIRCPCNLPANTNDIRNIVRQENTIRCPCNLPANTNDIRNIVRQENTTSCPMYNSQSRNDIGNITKPQNIFKPTVLNIRNPEYMFQMRSKIRKDNILPLNRNEMAIVRTECEQVLLYATTCFITPPRKNYREGN